MTAVQRGVSIQRIIIYSKDQDKDALGLAKEQHEAGIQVKLALREKVLPDQRINFAIWDARVSWEAQMNADGNPIATIYCVEPRTFVGLPRCIVPPGPIRPIILHRLTVGRGSVGIGTTPTSPSTVDNRPGTPWRFSSVVETDLRPTWPQLTALAYAPTDHS